MPTQILERGRVPFAVSKVHVER